MNRREALKIFVLAGSDLVLTACGGDKLSQATKIAKSLPLNSGNTHPTANPDILKMPDNAVLLYNEPDNRITGESIELYQNTPDNFMPFGIYVNKDAFKELDQFLLQSGVTNKGEKTRLVIHWPGNPKGSETLCDTPGTTPNFIDLELARAVYEHVYLPNFDGKNLNDPSIKDKFLAKVESQINLVLFHEVAHIEHCRKSVDDKTAEPDAIKKEAIWSSILPRVIYLKPKSNADFNTEIIKIKSLRGEN